MRSLILPSPAAMLREVSRRAVARRLAQGWTRNELAERSGVAPDTLKRFEQTGQVSFARLLRIAWALGAEHEFGNLFPAPSPQSIGEMEAMAAARQRKRVRGHSRARGRSAGPTITPEADDAATP